jgi:hypothetical protein
MQSYTEKWKSANNIEIYNDNNVTIQAVLTNAHECKSH